MKKYLIGEPHQSDPDSMFGSDDPMYPFRFVDIIDKKDLVRIKDHGKEFIVINLYEQTYYDLAKNEWVKIPETEKYNPWGKDKKE